MLTLDFIRDVHIYQSKTGYRFSVDALLLYSFINLQRAKKIADLGAGSGIIGLLLAKKYPDSEVTLIELQKSLVKLAEKNTALNELEDRVHIINYDLKELTHNSSLVTHASAPPVGNCFDLVVSNPPFRRTRTGLVSNSDERAIARHEIKLSLQDLFNSASLLLKHHGRFCLIHLPERLAEIIRVMKGHSLEPKRLRSVHSSISTEAKMVLIEAVKGARSGMKIESPLVLYNEDGSYTKELEELYRV